MSGLYNSTLQEAKALDLINRTRKFRLQRNLTLENSLGLRLSYARWLIIVGLFGYHLLDRSMRGKPFVLGTADYLIGVYAAFNVIVMLLSMSIGRRWRLMVTVTLVLDVIIAAAISLMLETPIFFFAYLPSLLVVVLIGVWEGVVSLLAVGALNFYYLISTNFNLQDQVPLQFYGLLGSLLLLICSFYVLTQSATPLIRISEEMLEEAMQRANEANLLEMQNRVKAVYRVANTLSATLDYQQVVNAILHELETVIDISSGVILVFEGSLSTMRVADALRLTPEEEKTSISVREGVIKRALNKGTPLLVTDEAELDEIRAFFPSMRNSHTAMLLPLRAGMEVFGLLLITSRNEHAYSNNDIELMVTLTAHSVLAMQNATLYRNLLEDRNKLLTQEEEVRHELARNLHDGPAQAVAAVSMQTEFIRRLFKTEPDRALEELANLGKQAQQTSREIRTLLYELRPLVLESQGLTAALEQYAKRFPHSPSDPQVHFSTANFDGRLAPQVETTIFTILQEAVNNARKHARARNIWLHIETRDGYIVATAQDDGRGFDVAAVESNYDKRGSLGMTNMRERAALVGGQVSIRSAIGQGTAIFIQIPINETTVPSGSNSTDY